MKNFTLYLLFLLIPLSSFGEGECSNGEIQIYIELWAISANGAGVNSLTISHSTNGEYLAVNFAGNPNYSYYTCLDNPTFGGYTWIITSYDENNLFNGSINIFLDGPDGELIESSNTNGQSNGTFFLEPIVPGCTDNTAENYNEFANTDDGSCIILGCTDDIYSEYNESANTDDGSCYTMFAACPYEEFTEYYPFYETINEALCQTFIVLGCTQYWADNYDDLATVEDGSCYREGCLNDWADYFDDLAT